MEPTKENILSNRPLNLNPNFLRKEDVKSLLDNRPQGMNPARIIESLVKGGYDLEGYNELKQQSVQRSPQYFPQQPKTNQNPLFLGFNIVKDFIGNTVKTALNLPRDVASYFPDANNPALNKNPLIAAPEAGLGIVSSLIRDVPFAPITGLAKAITDNISKSYEGNPEIVNNPVVGHIADFVGKNYEKLQSMARSHPEIINNLDNAITTILGIISAPGIVKSGEDIFGSVKKFSEDTVNKSIRLFKEYSPNEIESLPIEEAAKLKSDQYNYWVQKNITEPTEEKIRITSEKSSLNKGNIEAQGGIERTKIERDFAERDNQLEKEEKVLQRQLSQSGTKDVENLKPKARKLLSDKSKEFSELRDEAIKGREDIPVNKVKLSRIVDETVSDPNVAGIVKNKLGITGVGRGQKITLGEIYDRISSLREDIRGAFSVTGTPTPEDMANSGAIKVLNKIMADNGVDFSKANKFWSDWAPLRDDIKTKFKIFDKYDTATGSNVLKIRAMGMNVKYDNFLRDVEKEIGQPIDMETKNALNKLNDNEFLQKQAQIEKANKLIESKNLENYNKSEENRLLKERKGEINKQKSQQLAELNKQRLVEYNKAWKLRIIKGIIKGVLTFEGVKALIVHHL